MAWMYRGTRSGCSTLRAIRVLSLPVIASLLLKRGIRLRRLTIRLVRGICRGIRFCQASRGSPRSSQWVADGTYARHGGDIGQFRGDVR
jgi:hypothetical protein